MNDQTGGPAFPLQDASAWQFHGMTLRDYFAAAAMQAIIGICPKELPNAALVKDAYDVADAMIEARNK